MLNAAEESINDKRRRWASIEDAMRVKLNELKEEELAVEVSSNDPDHLANVEANDAIRLVDKVVAFLGKEHYEAAETLLRHIYRITTSRDARFAISSARKLCHESAVAEQRWVKKRATLLRKKADKTEIRLAKKKFLTDNRPKINDLLATAVLEIGEGVSRRGGEYYTKLHTAFEVILPPISDDSGMVLARAPLMFNAKSRVDERSFNQLMKKIHGVEPGLKRIERGFYSCEVIPIVGFVKKLNTDKMRIKATRKLKEKLKRDVNILETMLVHKTSALYWYAYDFPIETETMQFADLQVAEDYGVANAPFMQISAGKVSRDEFVKMREHQRLRRVKLLSMQLRSIREEFLNEHSDVYQEIVDLEDAEQELLEMQNKIKEEFARITSSDISEDGKAVNGLNLSAAQYKKLHAHMQKLYVELAGSNEIERDRLAEKLFEDRLAARELYYEHRELGERRALMADRRKHLHESLARARDFRRGTGKKVEKIGQI